MSAAKKTMVISKAYARYLRLSPRKTRQVIDLIRGEKVNRALAILANVNKRPKRYVEKTLKSALSNARLSPAVNSAGIFISKITADNGPMLRRFRAAAMGRAAVIRHRTTHLSVELSQEVEEKAKEKKVKKKHTDKKAKK